jgi:protocatechuate 3,4-dioxygenase beta subunit
MMIFVYALCLVLCGACQPAPGNSSAQEKSGKDPLPSCEWCGAAEAPQELSWETRIEGPDEPGEPLVISGTVFQPDGETPAPNVVLYLYHTNNEGVYPKRGDEKGNARRHGYLRAWLRTGERGQYRFTTIRPAPYPGRTSPAHIHVTVKEPDKPEYWLDSYIFEGDPLITPEHRARLRNRGGSGIVRLEKDDDGVWRAERDIILME